MSERFLDKKKGRAESEQQEQQAPETGWRWIVDYDGESVELTNLTAQEERLLYLLHLEDQREKVVGSWAYTGATEIEQSLYFKLCEELREIRAKIDKTIGEMQQS